MAGIVLEVGKVGRNFKFALVINNDGYTKGAKDVVRRFAIYITFGICLGILSILVDATVKKADESERIKKPRARKDMGKELWKAGNEVEGFKVTIERKKKTCDQTKDNNTSLGTSMEPAKAGPPNSQSEADFTQQELSLIGQNILGEWKLTAGLTGKFNYNEIDNIRLNIGYVDNVKKAIAMLNEYMMKKGTREALALALDEQQKRDVAQKVRSKHYQANKPVVSVADKFTQPEITRIGKEIPGKWETIASMTGLFNKSEINNISCDNFNYNDPIAKAIKMLNDYKDRQGTREGLASALEENHEQDIAQKVRSKYFQK